MHESHRPPLVLADGKLWQCSKCGATVPHDYIINPRQCACGSWSYRPVYNPDALIEADRRRSA